LYIVLIMENQNSSKTIRLDKWLKITRIFKTRSKAGDACTQGKVKVNDQVAKAAKVIKIGDTIAVRLKSRIRTFDVLDIVNKSIKAADARLLYNEHELSAEEKEAEDIRNLFYKSTKMNHPKYKGRPTKKERREMDRFRSKP
jgi:ribosome-associated heat shock protein Hsp15